MKPKMWKFAGGILLILAVLTTAQGQSMSQRMREIRAAQSEKTIQESAPCQRVRASKDNRILDNHAIDSSKLAKNLEALMAKSEDVVLVGISIGHDAVLSPSGQSVVTYYDAKVLRSWKGMHNPGEILTFGVPAGTLHCGSIEDHRKSFSTFVGNWMDWNGTNFGPYVLFLRHSEGKEAQLVEGLMPTGGQGVQGMFPIRLPLRSQAYDRCNGVLAGWLEWCDRYLEISQDPVTVPYVLDPLAKSYEGMAISEFLLQVRAAADAQGLAEKSSVR